MKMLPVRYVDTPLEKKRRKYAKIFRGIKMELGFFTRQNIWKDIL